MKKSVFILVRLGAICVPLVLCLPSGADTVRLAALSRPADPSTSEPAPSEVPLPPLSGPNDLPALDRSMLPPAEEKWDSPEEQAQHHRLMDQLWATKLGQMYLAYLIDPVPPSRVPARANQVANIVFADGVKAGGRVRVLQLLDQDMASRGQLNIEIMRRTLIFGEVVRTRENRGNEDLNRAVVNGAITTAIIAAPFGFQPLGEELGNAYDYASKWVYCRHRCDGVKSNLRRVLDIRNYGKYHPVKALRIFDKYFGKVSALYFAYNVWVPAWRARGKPDDLLSGKDSLLENAEF